MLETHRDLLFAPVRKLLFGIVQTVRKQKKYQSITRNFFNRQQSVLNNRDESNILLQKQLCNCFGTQRNSDAGQEANGTTKLKQSRIAIHSTLPRFFRGENEAAEAFRLVKKEKRSMFYTKFRQITAGELIT